MKESKQSKPILKRVVISLVSITALGYLLLFTGPGNKMIGAYMEWLLNTDPKVPIKVERFALQTDQVDMKLKISDLIELRVYGDYSLFGGDFDGKYLLSIADMSRLNIDQLIQMKAKGSFKSDGSIRSTKGGGMC